MVAEAERQGARDSVSFVPAATLYHELADTDGAGELIHDNMTSCGDNANSCFSARNGDPSARHI